MLSISYSSHNIEETKKILETYLPRNYKMEKAAIKNGKVETPNAKVETPN